MTGITTGYPCRLILIILLACIIAIGMTSCKRYNGNQTVHYTQFPDGATEMNLRWPEVPGQAPAVHFRIPREDVYLNSLVGDKPGEVDRVSLKIRIPEELARNLFTAREGRGKFPDPHPDRPYLKSVYLLQIPNNHSMRKRRFDQWSLQCRTSVKCILDGSIGDMIRYSEISCPGPEPSKEDLMIANDKDAWQKQVILPDKCSVIRSASYLSNSTMDDKGEEAVDVWCTTGSCEMNIQIRGRKVRTSIFVSQLEYADELSMMIREQLESYIVNDGEMK